MSLADGNGRFYKPIYKRDSKVCGVFDNPAVINGNQYTLIENPRWYISDGKEFESLRSHFGVYRKFINYLNDIVGSLGPVDINIFLGKKDISPIGLKKLIRESVENKMDRSFLAIMLDKTRHDFQKELYEKVDSYIILPGQRTSLRFYAWETIVNDRHKIFGMNQYVYQILMSRLGLGKWKFDDEMNKHLFKSIISKDEADSMTSEEILEEAA
jgi:hypothetical protein